jgi:hypothetical protein
MTATIKADKENVSSQATTIRWNFFDAPIILFILELYLFHIGRSFKEPFKRNKTQDSLKQF